jgi:outer membrane protein assembly factor BamB
VQRWPRVLAALCCAAATGAQAENVTLALVTPAEGRLVSIENRQALWKSPFGGWVATAWPFSLRVDDQPILDYRSGEQKLADASMAGQVDADAVKADALLGDLADKPERVTPEDLHVFRLDRKASVTLDLGVGRHVLQPLGIAFTIGADGSPVSQDPRVHVDARARRVEVICHPVTLRSVVEGRSVPRPLSVTAGGSSLTGGLEPLLAEHARKGREPAESAQAGLLRLTVYLPASTPERPYAVNGIGFGVGADGTVQLAAGTQARCVNGREIQLVAQVAKPVPASPVDAAPPPRERSEESGGGAASTLRSATPARKASISLFTYHNRGLFRRGDPVEVFWCVKNAVEQPAVECAVTLSGRDLKVAPGSIALPKRAAGGVASGIMKLDTAALAPGEYEVSADLPGATCYPLRFRVSQREPLSDYTVYAYVYGAAGPYASSPVNAYYGAIPGGPGLDPVLKEVDASLDPALAASAKAPGGPAPEKFIRPSPEEARLMALAALGMRTVLQYPTMLYHEDWNPKHTLPEDLAQMRRRLALFVQPLAGLAGLGGLTMGWYATLQGNWWEDVPCQDGNVARRNAAVQEWVKAQVAEAAKQAETRGIAGADLDAVNHLAELRAGSSVLPNAWAEYLADVRQMAPGLTSHNAIPSWWLGGGSSYAPYAYRTLTHRDAVDYSDYGLTAWGNFRTPAWMNMGNRNGQKLQCNFMANQMHNRIVTSFGATGRGLDGISMPCDGDYPQGQDEALRRLFERFGSYFSALEPLPDVALFYTDTNPQNVAMHDLARMRRPAMLLGPEDVLAGELAKYRVLFLVSARKPVSTAILDAFRKFETAGGIIVKDRTCHASLPGRDLGFGYEGAQVHPVWGLAYANGEDEFAHLWRSFKETREKFLVETFAKIPGLPVTTADPDAVISPLAGKDSICCFVMNQTLAPTNLVGRWRQYFILPKTNELRVEEGWHVRNLLTGRPAAMEKTTTGQRTVVDFTRMEGAIFLLTKREPTRMAIRAERTAPCALRLTGWLADAAEKPLADPMPFEVTLRGPDGAVLFHKFAALSPDLALEVPVPALTGAGSLQLAVRDLVLGSTATQALAPAPPAAVTADTTPDFIGGSETVAAFLVARKGPVTILLDEGQNAFRPAADQLAMLLKKSGREASVVQWDPSDVRPLPLRWNPTADDKALIAALAGGRGFAGRIGLGAVSETNPKTGQTVKIRFEDPDCGYDEYGPRLRHDADIVLFGSPETHLALAQLAPYLRRTPSETYPAAGGFFVHYLWSPFQGGYDGLYVGCRDAAGAAAAVATLAELASQSDRRGTGFQPVASSVAHAERDDGLEARPTKAAKSEGAPLVTPGAAPAPLEDMLTGKFGRPVLDIAFAPGGRRVFAIVAGIGKQLFALTPDGQVQETSELHHRRGGLYQSVQAPLKALDERTAAVGVGGTTYRYSLDKGFISRWSPPTSGFFGKQTVRAAASPVLNDQVRSRTYLGGKRRIHALDGQGRWLWTCDDEAEGMSDQRLFYPRNLYPRAVSGNGRVLLVAGFGSREMLSAAHPANQAVFGLDTATGKVLWKKGLFLNEGSVVPLDDGFMVVDDAGTARVLKAADGAETGRMRPIKGTAWIRPVPGRAEMLIVENDAFDRNGPTARVFFRPLDGAPDRELPVAGRLTDAQVLPDGQSVVLATVRGETLRLATADGRTLWRAETPSGGIVRLTPDGNTVWVGARDGVLHRLDAATGKLLGTVDLNPYNVTTPEHFVQQMDAVGEVPVANDVRTPPLEPIDPSLRTTLDPKKVPLGKNLIGANVEQGVPAPFLDQLTQVSTSWDTGGDARATAVQLPPETVFKLRVEAGTTYLVELLAGAADAAKLTPRTRLEIVVTGARKTANLPYVGRLPLTDRLACRRAAFRADESGEVMLTLRAVEPGASDEGHKAQATYAQAAPSPAGLLVGEGFVGAIGFKGLNLLLEGGPKARRQPVGDLECTVFPWTGGSTLVRTQPYPCVQSALRMVNGRIGDEDSAWGPSASGSAVDRATGVVRFRKPQTLTAIAIYEDNTGPVLSGDGVLEKTASRFGVYVRKAGAKDLTYVGHVTDNTQLVNVFACPSVPVSEIHYVWAGRTDSGKTDGPVRMAEIEAYADEIAAMDDVRKGQGDEVAPLDLGL